MRRKPALFVLPWLLIIPAAAQEKQAGETYTLSSAVAAALERNPLAQAIRLEVRSAGLEVKKALYRKYLPALDFSLNSGLVPGARGDIFYSPDQQTDLDDWGMFYRLDFSLVQPLFTFGRASSAVEAARSRLDVEESRSDRAFDDLSLEVIKAYWSLQASRKAKSLARQSAESFDRLIDEIQKRLDREDSEVDDQDLLEAKSHLIDIEFIRQESIEDKALAERSFRMLLDLDSEAEITISEEAIPEFLSEPDVPVELADLAGRLRPEIRGLGAAVKGLDAQINYHKSQKLPVLFLAAGLSYAHAGNRQDQKNPFAVDNFNYRALGASLGLRWDPTIWIHNVDIQKAKDEQRALMEKLRALRASVWLEVSRAYVEAKKNDALLRAARSSLDAAKTWMLVSQDNWDMGIGDAFRLLRAYQSYFELRGTEIEREYEFNISVAKLAYAIGALDLYLRWVDEGKVTLE